MDHKAVLKGLQFLCWNSDIAQCIFYSISLSVIVTFHVTIFDIADNKVMMMNSPICNNAHPLSLMPTEHHTCTLENIYYHSLIPERQLLL